MLPLLSFVVLKHEYVRAVVIVAFRFNTEKNCLPRAHTQVNIDRIFFFIQIRSISELDSHGNYSFSPRRHCESVLLLGAFEQIEKLNT